MALSISQHPAVPSLDMASRRVPLADVAGAVNSPMRAAGSGKRTRAQTGEPRDTMYGQPPAKKHIIEAPSCDVENIDPARRNLVIVSAKDRLDEPFAKRANSGPPTAFQKKLASVVEKKSVNSQRQKTPVDKIPGDSIESVRQWQKHYRKQFPQFVFYFDGVPEDVRYKSTRLIYGLGGREEKFFSKAVTHVVTTRAIPAECAEKDAKHETVASKTVLSSAILPDQRRSTSLLDVQAQRRIQSNAQSMQPSNERGKSQPYNADILLRARELKIKIWALEKLQRVLNAMFESENGDGSYPDQCNIAGGRHIGKAASNADLEQLLRNEKINGPADRDLTVATQDMTVLRGCYVYVHDMDEKVKPTMAREYTKPANREDGKWPQFRLTPIGRCPFVEDTAYKKKMQQKEQDAPNKQDAAQKQNAAPVAAQCVPVRTYTDREPNLRRSPRKLPPDSRVDSAKTTDTAKPLLSNRNSSIDPIPPLFGSAQVNLRGLPRMVAGEPVASGMQPSNVTSAIRSQAVSSAAMSSTAPGLNRRVGDTKEVSMLKRKVLERRPSSYMQDVRMAINDDNGPPPRAAKRKAQETLGVVHEDDEGQCSKASAPVKKKATAASAAKEPKAGYCENCRDKFDDFDEHVVTRKHRKFALAQENWDDLDELLGLLKRPHKLG